MGLDFGGLGETQEELGACAGLHDCVRSISLAGVGGERGAAAATSASIGREGGGLARVVERSEAGSSLCCCCCWTAAELLTGSGSSLLSMDWCVASIRVTLPDSGSRVSSWEGENRLLALVVLATERDDAETLGNLFDGSRRMEDVPPAAVLMSKVSVGEGDLKAGFP